MRLLFSGNHLRRHLIDPYLLTLRRKMSCTRELCINCSIMFTSKFGLTIIASIWTVSLILWNGTSCINYIHSRWGCVFWWGSIPVPGQAHLHHYLPDEVVNSRWGKSPFSVRMCIPGKAHPNSRWSTSHSRWGTSPFPVRICTPGEAHPHSRWSTSPFPVGHIPIPGEAHPHSQWGTSPFPVNHIPIPSEAHPHSRWGTSLFPVRHIPFHSEDVHYWWGTFPFPMKHIPIPGEDFHSIVIYPHRECTSSPGMGMCITGNAHSLYRAW